MHLQNTIKQFWALLLLLVFTLAVTPKKFLHDTVANHKHQLHYTKNSCRQVAVTVAGFNCQVDNLVVDIPFEVVATFRFNFQKQFFNTYRQSVELHCHVSSYYSHTLRGPPAC